tara:strand:+ start:2489 stop:4120 length:1632 start_codon:yes stop_codon:yes gene_type:complete
MLTKKFKRNYHKDWLKQLDSSESKQDRKWFNYFKKENDSIIDEFLALNKQIPDLQFKFKESDLRNLYVELYQEIGNKFAKWYASNFDKYIAKNISVEYNDIWNEKFAYIGGQVAGERVVSIAGNRRKEFVKTLKRYMADPDFQSMNEARAGRILRKKFDELTVSNAKRIVRTESVNAANYATNQSAVDIFGKENLKKEWIATLDNRVRIDHIEANGQVVNMEENFLVGGEELAYPGDSRGSAANVINCRCTNAPFPKEEVIEESIPERIEPMPVRVPGQRIIQEERPKFYPSQIDELKELGFQLGDDDGYLRNFVKPVNFKIVKNSTKNYYRPSENTIYLGVKNTLDNWWTKGNGKGVLVHEIGHSIHTTRKLSYNVGVNNHYAHPKFAEKMKDWRDRLLVNKRFNVDKMSDMFEKLDTKGLLKINNSALANNLNRGEGVFTPLDNARKLFPNIPESKVTFDWVTTNDFFGAINNMKYFGFGHSKRYYIKKKSNSFAEVFANVYEWKYNGNVIMEKYFPQLYKEALDLLDELLESGEFTPIKL